MMKRLIQAGLALAAALSLPVLPAAVKIDLKRVTPVPADKTIPIQDFFRLSALQEPKLNPAGTHIAALMSPIGQDKFVLTAYELASGKTETVGGVLQQEVYDFTWLNNERLVYQLGDKKLYAVGLMAVELGRFRNNYPVQAYNGARIIGIPPDKRHQPLLQISAGALEGSARNLEFEAITVDTDFKNIQMANLTRNATMDDYFKARENNRRNRLHSQAGPKAMLPRGLMADRNGALEFALSMENGVDVLHYLADGTWHRSPLVLDHMYVMGPGRRTGEIIVRGPATSERPAPLRFIDAVTGEANETLIEDKEYDFAGSVYRDPKTREIVGASYHRAGPHVTWFREDYAAYQKLFNGQFPGQVVRIISNSEDGKIFLLATWSDRHPVAYHWVNLGTKSAGLIKNSAPWIDPQRMRPMMIIKFKTRDGRSLDAYLTLPEGATKENPPPLVVLPHGGPWARDTWGFNGEVQFLASRGYAVLQPQYRGSTGYDWLFPREDRFEFRKMHDDVTDATRAVIKAGFVDNTRVAIMGASFGAYLALSGVAHEPELYRCAVTNAGVFDWEEVLRDRKFNQFDDPSYSWLVRYLGDPKKEQEKFAAISPVRHVAKVRVPVFVAHGKDDFIAPVTESRRLVSELKKHNLEHETLFVGDEGHGMGNLDNQVELYGRIEAFLAKHLMPKR
jgi:dienelactone hydrolase